MTELPPIKQEERSLAFRMGVPLPLSNARETDHLRHCSHCQSIWPAYFSQYKLEFNCSLEYISNEWNRTPEHQRLKKARSLVLWKERFFKNTKIRSTSRHYYQHLYYHRFFDVNSTFRTRVLMCQAEFDMLPPDYKEYYHELHKKYSRSAWLTRPDTPKYMKREFKVFQDKRYKCPYKRPVGPFHIFVEEMKAQDPTLKNHTMISAIQLCKERFSELSPEILTQYQQKFKERLAEFKRLDIEERFKFENKRKSEYYGVGINKKQPKSQESEGEEEEEEEEEPSMVVYDDDNDNEDDEMVEEE